MANLYYRNKGSGTIRNKNITQHLFNEISKAIRLVYGVHAYGEIYSGGQSDRRRTGTVRHDNGRAADIHVFHKSGLRIKGEELGKLAQYWAASKIGGVGLEMVGGGIHLDEWATPPIGGGMYWFYHNKELSKIVKAKQRDSVLNGIMGNMPEVKYVKQEVKQNPFVLIFEWIMRLFNGSKK